MTVDYEVPGFDPTIGEIQCPYCMVLTLVLLNPDMPYLCKQFKSYQSASELLQKWNDLDLHCLLVSM